MSARIVAGIVGVGVFVAAIGAAVTLPFPSYAAKPHAVSVTPVAADQLRVCPGPLLELGADSEKATATSSFGSPGIVASFSGGAKAAVGSITAPDDVASGSGPQTLTMPADQSADHPQFSGSQSQEAGQETLAGFAAAACAEASAESWLVGGSTDVGQTSLLLLSNPSAVDSLVDVTVYGDQGIVDAPGAHDIVVAAGTQHVVSLAGLAPNLQVTGVKVSSRGGQIQASLQQAYIRGLTPAGVEMVGVAATPSMSQSIAGVVVSAAQPVVNGDTYSALQPGIRVLAPGADTADIHVDVMDASGVVVQTIDASVDAGSVDEFPLENLAAGTYSLVVTSNAPVTAAARTAAVTAGGTDFSWYPASKLLTDTFDVAVAQGPAANLKFFNGTSSAQNITIDGPAGPTIVELQPNATASVGVSGGSTLTVSGSKGITASLSYAGVQGVSAFALNPPNPASEPIDVYLR